MSPQSERWEWGVREKGTKLRSLEKRKEMQRNVEWWGGGSLVLGSEENLWEK